MARKPAATAAARAAAGAPSSPARAPARAPAPVSAACTPRLLLRVLALVALAAAAALLVIASLPADARSGGAATVLLGRVRSTLAAWLTTRTLHGVPNWASAGVGTGDASAAASPPPPSSAPVGARPRVTTAQPPPPVVVDTPAHLGITVTEHRDTQPTCLGSLGYAEPSVSQRTYAFERGIRAALEAFARTQRVRYERAVRGDLAHVRRVIVQVSAGSGPQRIGTGFGNRFEGIVSMLMLAAVDDVLFLMDDDPAPRMLDEFEPFPFPYRAEPVLEALQRAGRNRTRAYETALDADWVCADPERTWASVDVVRVIGNIYSGSLLWYSPVRRARAESLFGPLDLEVNPFAVVARWLLRPRPALHAFVSAFRAAHFDGAKYVIGVQARASESYVPDALLHRFGECARDLAHEYTPHDAAEVVYFVMTDNYAVVERMRAQLSPARVVTLAEPAGGSLKRNDGINHVLRANTTRGAADLLLFGMCTDSLVTLQSSYGRVAYSMADRKPRVLVFDSRIWNTRKHAAGSCPRANTARPCSHRFQQYAYAAACVESDELRAIARDECLLS